MRFSESICKALFLVIEEYEIDRLLFDSSFGCCSYSANCGIMFSYSLVIQERVRPLLRGVLTQAFSHQIPMT